MQETEGLLTIQEQMDRSFRFNLGVVSDGIMLFQNLPGIDPGVNTELAASMQPLIIVGNVDELLNAIGTSIQTALDNPNYVLNASEETVEFIRSQAAQFGGKIGMLADGVKFNIYNPETYEHIPVKSTNLSFLDADEINELDAQYKTRNAVREGAFNMYKAIAYINNARVNGKLFPQITNTHIDQIMEVLKARYLNFTPYANYDDFSQYANSLYYDTLKSVGVPGRERFILKVSNAIQSLKRFADTRLVEPKILNYHFSPSISGAVASVRDEVIARNRKAGKTTHPEVGLVFGRKPNEVLAVFKDIL